MIRFGWFETDGEHTYTVETGTPIPLVWQRLHLPGERMPIGVVRDSPSFEGLVPLENKLSLWLFGDYERGCWEVTCTLWTPCPIHPRETLDARRCEYWAMWVPGREGEAVTQPEGCAGSACDGCWHYNPGWHTGPHRFDPHYYSDLSIKSDPGDEEEFRELTRLWSGLEIIINGNVADHVDHFDYCVEHNIEA
jgi:hypothetical protein